MQEYMNQYNFKIDAALNLIETSRDAFGKYEDESRYLDIISTNLLQSILMIK